MNKLKYCCLLAVALVGVAFSSAHAGQPERILAELTTQSAAVPSPTRGQHFFNVRHSTDWSCASCHGAIPNQAGKHVNTGKTIGALAPAFNADRFSDAAKTEKWFRRNCNDVLGRECTSGEKADVLAWLLTIKP